MQRPQGEQRRGRIRYYYVILLFVAVLSVVGGGVWLWRSAPRPVGGEPDWNAAVAANSRGIALLEWFDENYQGQPASEQAIAAFEEAVRLAPDWLAARINLGIALLNNRDKDPRSKEQKLQRAAAVFQDVLARDPDNPYAHYCLGIIHFDRGERAVAGQHFAAVTRIDPQDAHAWYFLGRCAPDEFESPEAKECFERALQLNPYLNAARHSLAQHAAVVADRQLQTRLFEEFEALRQAEVEDYAAVSYTEMGRYATAIGTPPRREPPGLLMPMFERSDLTVTLESGTHWVRPEQQDPLLAAIRQPFGGGMLLFDFDQDGLPDVLLLAAAVRQGQTGNLLLRNCGEGRWQDVSTAAGIASVSAGIGGAAADFDNDGFPDLVITTPQGLVLLRNLRGQRFEDVTARAGLSDVQGVFLTARWADLDQDGDLDLLAACYAADAASARSRLRSEAAPPSGRLMVLINVGEAPPAERGQPAPPLTPAFQLAAIEPLAAPCAVSNVLVSDLDGDGDLDLLVFREDAPPLVLLNERLLRFRTVEPLAGLTGLAGLVLDANADEQADWLILEAEASPRVWLSQSDRPARSLEGRFTPRPLDAPPLVSAQVCDLDCDGQWDLLGVGRRGELVLLRGEGQGRWQRVLSPFGSAAERDDLLAVVAADVDGDGLPDGLIWSAAAGLQLYRNRGNGGHALHVTLNGKWDKGKKQRSNSGGIGSRLWVYAGARRVGAEWTTLTAGLAQSHLPLQFGLGPHAAAEALQVRWPDFVPQAELQVPAGRVTIAELSRKSTSCPVLFVWNGERFVFVTDILGAGAMGELNPDGSVRPPRGEESLRLQPGLLHPQDGHYLIKLAEPMDEVMYLDTVQLEVVDHPGEWSVYPDERFATAPPLPTQELLFFRKADCRRPRRAVDHRGRDVAELLQRRDGRYYDAFAVRAWLGYAEEHWIVLEFDRRKSSSQQYLLLAGWTDYAYPESIYAARQAGVAPIWPRLERQTADGRWEPVMEIGIPAGLPRVMTVPLPAGLDAASGPLRIRTNLQVYWDEIVLAERSPDPPHRRHRLLPVQATLEHRGFALEQKSGPDAPPVYDHDRLENVTVSRWQGRLTRTGDVTELLHSRNDRFVIAGPGDELSVRFDARELPPLPPGWQRTVILRAAGYSKDTAPTTLTGGKVLPLPYQAMPNYPYDARRHPPPHQADYDRQWNTRPVRGR